MGIATLPAETRVHRWTKGEYYAVTNSPAFAKRRVELLGGEIFDMSPIGPLHAAVVAHVHGVLSRLFPGHHVRAQLPFDAGEDSEPEPDLAVVPGKPLDYADAHPRQADLIVEVADWSIAYDRGRKASKYAASGITDYWVINLPARRVEVFRKPVPDPAQPFGAGYASHDVLDANANIAPQSFPAVTVAVRDLLP